MQVDTDLFLGWRRAGWADDAARDYDVCHRALAVFAERYARQNERDRGALEEAARTGRVAAEGGV
jgi:hypothetical protein